MEKIKKLMAKGILKGCHPPIKPIKNKDDIYFRTCPMPLLEKIANEHINHPSFNVDEFLSWYVIFKIIRERK